jgi:periplasmic divalent cation tolerance protein
MEREAHRFVVLFSTAGSAEEAGKIAEHLVSYHIAACVNIIPGIQSVYWWNNQISKDQEVLMIIKTEASKIPEVESALHNLHSYQTPELIALPIEYGMNPYLDWILDSVNVKK